MPPWPRCGPGAASTLRSCHGASHAAIRFSLQRLLSYLWLEALELRRDPIRPDAGVRSGAFTDVS